MVFLLIHSHPSHTGIEERERYSKVQGEDVSAELYHDDDCPWSLSTSNWY